MTHWCAEKTNVDPDGEGHHEREQEKMPEDKAKRQGKKVNKLRARRVIRM